MKITNVMMSKKPGIKVDGIVLSDVDIDGKLHPSHSVIVYVEQGVEYPNPEKLASAFEEWVQDQAASAIRTKDDRITPRPNIWPDKTQHADVYRAWHDNNVDISIWTTRVPKPPFVP